jgi:hypothetical protein
MMEFQSVIAKRLKERSRKWVSTHEDDGGFDQFAWDLGHGLGRTKAAIQLPQLPQLRQPAITGYVAAGKTACDEPFFSAGNWNNSGLQTVPVVAVGCVFISPPRDIRPQPSLLLLV